MTVLGIDPGTNESAYVLWADGAILAAGIEPNETLLRMLQFKEIADLNDTDVVAIEMVASYGMPVGREVFETVLWIGRMYEHCRPEPTLIYRKDVKMFHCGSARAKDANIRQAILDKFGGKNVAIGKKHSPGIFYGVKSHIWAALALALYAESISAVPRFKVKDAPRTGEIDGVPPSGAAENLVSNLTS